MVYPAEVHRRVEVFEGSGGPMIFFWEPIERKASAHDVQPKPRRLWGGGEGASAQ